MQTRAAGPTDRLGKKRTFTPSASRFVVVATREKKKKTPAEIKEREKDKTVTQQLKAASKSSAWCKRSHYLLLTAYAEIIAKRGDRIIEDGGRTWIEYASTRKKLFVDFTALLNTVLVPLLQIVRELSPKHLASACGRKVRCTVSGGLSRLTPQQPCGDSFPS